jgi:uridine kinase
MTRTNHIDLPGMAAAIITRRASLPPSEAMLVALSGIDGSGKGYITEKLVAALSQEGVGALPVNLDAWHHPPEVRFSTTQPGEHFYEHAFRFEELFCLLVRPLKHRRSLRLTVELTRLPENDRFQHTYDFQDVDVILLEGIFLLKRELRPEYDLAFWIECSFETALERALQRNQEGLPPEEIVRDYHTIYFPAQRTHLARDDPKGSATALLVNDPRLSSP